MTSFELYEMMENPGLLSVDSLPGLKQLVDDFPFFQTARMLYLKNLARVEDIRFPSELKKMSVYISDRRQLFALVEGERYALSLRNDSVSTGPVEKNTFSLIEDFLASNTDKDNPRIEESLLFQPSVSSDYIYWALTEEVLCGKPPANPSSPELRHQELIDDFIENEGKRPAGSRIMQTDREADPMFNPEDTDGNNVTPVEDSFFTETLARIYIKQKRYEKALQIIKNLRLKYPEKNIYFADQIRFLEKLIINTKK